jgi:Equine arteritis virus serine endopeptidase S32.
VCSSHSICLNLAPNSSVRALNWCENCSITFTWYNLSSSRLYVCSRVAQIVQKSRSHLSFLGARMVTRNKFHALDPQALVATVQDFVARVTKRPGFLHLCCTFTPYCDKLCLISLLQTLWANSCSHNCYVKKQIINCLNEINTRMFCISVCLRRNTQKYTIRDMIYVRQKWSVACYVVAAVVVVVVVVASFPSRLSN